MLLIHEAQGMSPVVLNELRLLASARFASRSLLCAVLAGDVRWPEKRRRARSPPKEETLYLQAYGKSDAHASRRAAAAR